VMRQIHKLETQEKENDQDNNEKKTKKKRSLLKFINNIRLNCWYR
jgi:hypothetical protein